MSKYVSIHSVTTYGLNNLNRDEIGRPKTAFIQGTERARISSQCLKRHWRMSKPFDNTHRSIRTKQIAVSWIQPHLSVLPDDIANAWTPRLLCAYGIRGDKEATVLITENEKKLLDAFMDAIVKHHTQGPAEHPDVLEECILKILNISQETPKKKKKESKSKKPGKNAKAVEEVEDATDDSAENVTDADDAEKVTDADEESKKYYDKVAKLLQPHLLEKTTDSLDAALWGRMWASAPEYNMTAACQVAHSFTLDAVRIEADYFTTVDDLNTEAQQGSAYLGEAQFTSGAYISQVIINVDVLRENLKGDEQATQKALQRMVEAMATVTPNGKQSTMMARNFSEFMVIEKSDFQLISYSSHISSPPIHGTETRTVIAETARRFRQKMQEHDANYPNWKIERFVWEKSLCQHTLEEAIAFVVA